jgi:YHS domain-containing protein
VKTAFETLQATSAFSRILSSQLNWATSLLCLTITGSAWSAAPQDFTVEAPADGRVFQLAELQEKPVPFSHYNLGPDKVALQGYDPVNYFTKSQALKGRKEIRAQHRGVTYCFASEENKQQFTEAPDRYVPTYGGWCATAMAKGEKVEIDPTNFKITNGRLFLFFKAFYANAQKDWNKDETNLTAKADANWKKIAGE